MVMSRIHFYYFIIFIHLLLIAACTESSSSKSNAQVSSLSAGVSLLNVAGSWTEPTEVTRYVATTPGSGIYSAKLHMTPQGDTLIAMQTRQHGLLDKVDMPIAYRAPGSTTWQQERPFDSLPVNLVLPEDQYIIGFPEIHTQKSSNYAFATFVAGDEQAKRKYISRFDPAAGWSPPVSLGDIDTGGRWGQQEAFIGASDNASLIWATYADNGTVELHARSFDASNGLSLMSTLVRGQPSAPDMFLINAMAGYIDAQGITHVYWYESEGMLYDYFDDNTSGQTTLWQSEYDVVKGWAIPSQIAEGTLLGARSMEQMQAVQEATTGNILVWAKSGGGPMFGPEISALHYREGSWLKTRVPPLGGDLTGSKLSINTKGEMVFVWTEMMYSSSAKVVLWSQRFSLVDGWSMAEIIWEKVQPEPLGGSFDSTYEIQVDINNNGHVVVLWRDIYSITRDYYAMLYIPESGWGEPQLVITRQAQISTESMSNILPMAKMNDDNQTTVSWVDIFRNSQDITYQVMVRDHLPGAAGATLATQNQNSANIKPASTVVQFDNRRQNQPLLTRQMAVSATANQRPLSIATGQRLSSVWDSPTEINTVVLPVDASSYFMGPRLWANNQEAAFVYWNGGSQVLDAAGSASASSAIFRRESKEGPWLSYMPLAEEALSASVLIGIYMQQDTGIAYAMWHGACDGLCDELYVSRFEPDLGWDVPTLIANTPCCGQLFLDAEGNVTALWRGNELGAAPDPSLPNASAQSQWVARRYVHGTGWLPPGPSITNDPVVNRIQGHEMKNNMMVAGGFDDGRIFMLWDESSEDRKYSSFAAQFDPTTGWSELEMRMHPFSNFGDPTMHINQQADRVQIFVSSLAFSPYGFSKPQLSAQQFYRGNWLSEQPNNNVADTSDFIGYPPYVSDSRSSGEVVFVAQERLFALDNRIASVVLHAYYFSPLLGWATDTGTFITDPIPLTDTSVVGMPFVEPLEKLQISVNESGDAAIAWIDNSSLERALYVSHYQPASGWGSKERVATLDGNSQYFGELDLHLDDKGQLSLVWDQVSVTFTTLEHRIYSTVHHDKGSVVAPPLDDTPLIGQGDLAKSANWSDSVLAYQGADLSGGGGGGGPGRGPGSITRYLMEAPLIRVRSSDSVLLSNHAIVNNYSYDPMVPESRDDEVSLKTFTVDGQWQDITPVQTDKPITGRIQTVNDSANNVIYAAWLSNDALFLNWQSVNQWSVPVSVASNVSEFFLLTNASGVVYLLWQDALDVQTLNLDIVNSSADGNIQLNTPSSITVAQGRLTGAPTMDLQANVWAMWYVDEADASKKGFLLSQYTKEVGWAETTPRLALEGMDPDLGLIDAAGTDGVVFISQEINSRQLMAIDFSSSTGWGAWQALGSQESPTSALIGLPRLVTNNKADAMILWVEEQKSTSGDIGYKAYTRQYIARAWQPASLVANIAYPNRNEAPDLFLADDGRALVLWVKTIKWRGVLYANKFSPDTGWLETPEIVAHANDLDFSRRYYAPKGAILPNGKIVAVWRDSNAEIRVLSAVSEMQ